MKTTKNSSIKEILLRNSNDWIGAERLQEFNKTKRTVDEIIQELRSEGSNIEERMHQDHLKKIKFYRLVRKPVGSEGEWRCVSCYLNVSKEFSSGLEPTLADNIRSGYCPKCGKRRWFNPA